MAGQRPITKWSVLALIVIVIGGATTLLLGQLWLEQWARTGQRAAIGLDQTVDLPAGRILVYYESTIAVPEIGTASLSAFDPYGRRGRAAGGRILAALASSLKGRQICRLSPRRGFAARNRPVYRARMSRHCPWPARPLFC